MTIEQTIHNTTAEPALSGKGMNLKQARTMRWLRRRCPATLFQGLTAVTALTVMHASAVTETFDSYAGGVAISTVGGGGVWTNGGSLVSPGGVNGTTGIGPSGTIFNWKGQPFVWSSLAAGTKVAMSLDFQTDANGKFDDDRVGWTITPDASTSTPSQLALQLDNNQEGGMVFYHNTTRTPVLNALAGIKISTWYRFNVEFTKLTATSAGIVGTLTELDATGTPTGTPYVGTIADTSTFANAPNTALFTPGSGATFMCPTFKNHTGAAANADNASFTLTPPASGPTVTLGLSGSPLAEAAGVATVTATLSATHTLPVTVNLAFSGTATPTTDYTASANSIVIAAGSTSGSVTLTAVQDSVYENPNETIVVDIGTVTNGTESGTQQVTATITDDDAAPSAVQYVIFISVDGLGGTYLGKIFDGTAIGGPYSIPNFTRLKNEGASTLAAHCDNNNWETLPNHTSIMTGRPRDGTAGHNWTSNGDPGVGQTIHTNKGSYVVSGFDVAHDNGLRTGMYANKTKFSLFDTTPSYTGGGSYNATYGALDTTGVNNGRDKIDNTYINTALGGIIVDTYITQQKSASPNHYAFLHINETDAYGHSSGWGSATWNAQAVVVDGMIGKLFKLIETDVPAMTGHTAIVLTADHGNQDNPPTGADRYQVPFYVWGPGVPAGVDLYALNAGKRQVAATYPMTVYTGMQPVRNAEASNLALDLIGLNAIPGSMFDSTHDLTVTASPPVVTLGVSGSPLAEAAGVATVTATLSTTYPLPVTVNLAFSGTATLTTDYTRSGTSIVIAAGSTTGSVTLTAVQDSVYENPNETIVVDISTVTNGTESGIQTVTASIADDDPAPVTSIAVGASGSGIMTFATLPGVSQWSTLSVTGASGDAETDTALDTAMTTIAATSITNTLATQAGSGTNASAYWRSGDLKLGTQPTGNKMTLLMASLANTSGGTLDSLTASYTMGMPTITPGELIKGHRVYWSKTGAAGSWTAAGDYILTTAAGTLAVNCDLAPLAWANGESLYVVWADDNGAAGTDGDFTIDDVSFAKTVPAANILTFGLPGNPAVIDQSARTIAWTVPYGTLVTALAPTFTMSPGATCVPVSGSTQDFTGPVHYIGTSSDLLVTKDYTVTVGVTPASSAKDMLTFGLPGIAAVISGTNILLTVPSGTDLTTLAPTYTVSTFATGSPVSGTSRDFTTAQTYLVTAQDLTTQTYTVTVVFAPTITWATTPLDISATGTGAEILNTGIPVIANHFYGGTAAPVTLDNGLTFGTNYIYTTPAGWSGGQNTYTDAHGIVPLLTDATPFGYLMRRYTWSSVSTHTLNIPGLMPGHTYRLQLISVAGKEAGVAVEGNASVPWTDSYNSIPSVLSGTWVQGPEDTELNVVLTRNTSFSGAHDNELQANGYALHDLTPDAGTVSVNFDADSNTPALAPTDYAGAAGGINWNNVTATSGLVFPTAPTQTFHNSANVDVSGFSIALSTAGGNTWNTVGSANQNLYGDWAMNGGGTLTFAGIPYASYDIYVYFNGFGGDDTVNYTIGTNTQTLVEAGDSPGTFTTFVQNKNYVKFSGLSGSTQTMTVAGVTGGDYGVSAFQIVNTTPTGPTDPFASWIATAYPSLSDKSATGDPDGDGLTNHEEYAFGLDPSSGSSVNPIIVPPDKTTGTFKYTRRATPATTGLTYTVWTSTNLAGWTKDDAASTGQAVESTSGDVETVAVTLSGAPLTESTLFMRITAE